MTLGIGAAVDGSHGVLDLNGAAAVTFTQNGQASTLFNISASVASNALTISLANTALQFRNTSLTSGAPLTAVTGALSITVPTSATLGTANEVAARLAVLVAYNSGTPVLCVSNTAGGVQLDETNLISPTTISASATASNVIYSASAVSAGSPYRVVGFVGITQATAGTWATAPTVVQGSGGQALAALSSLGYGQTWQTVTRAAGTTYYNTTGRPILVHITASGTTAGSGFWCGAVVNGVTFPYFMGSYSTTGSGGSILIPVDASYVLTFTNMKSVTWLELR